MLFREKSSTRKPDVADCNNMPSAVAVADYGMHEWDGYAKVVVRDAERLERGVGPEGVEDRFAPLVVECAH